MTLSYDAGTFTLETREGTFEFVGRDIVSIEGRAKKTIVKLSKAGMPHMLRLAASNGFTYASTLEGYRQDSIAIDISGGGGTTDLFTNTTASEFVKTNATNDGLESVNLFGGTTASQAVQANSTNDGLESMALKMSLATSTITKNILIGSTVNEVLPTLSNVISICTEKDSGDILTASALNGQQSIVSIDSPPLLRGGIVAIGNFHHELFLVHGAFVNKTQLSTVSSDRSITFQELCAGIYNSTDSAKTVTITNTQVAQFSSLAISPYLNSGGTEYQFIVDNSLATGTNTLTLVFTNAMFVVPTPADLVVAAGKIVKFSLVIGVNGKAIINKIF